MVAAVVRTHMIGEAERPVAAAVANLLSKVTSGVTGARLVLETTSGATPPVHLTAELAGAFLELSRMIETGETEVSFIADDPELSPEEASQLLGMSRPMVVQRIKLGDIAARMVGTHHRIKKSELLAFREREAQREAALAEFGEITDGMSLKHGS